MRIAVFGATGGTGRSLVEQALERGHDVVALVRRPGALDGGGPRLSVVEGDALDRDAVAGVVAGSDAVTCVLGLPKGEGTTISEGTRNICEAMSAAGVERLVVASVMGLRDSRDAAGFFGKVVMPLFMKKRMEDRVRQEEVVEGSGLDYCIARAARLVDGPLTKEYTGGPGVRGGMTSKLTRPDFAHFVLEQAENGDVHRAAASVVGD